MTTPGYRTSTLASALAGAALLLVGCGAEGQLQDAAALGPKAQLSLVAADVCAIASDPSCVPSGAHAKHTPTCAVCHAVAGRLAFQIGGPAYGAGWTTTKPRPSFDATAKTCSNVACHAMPAGTFSYYFQGGDGEAVLNTVSYGGGAPRPTPSWYATGGATCSACHDNPPRNGSDGSNVWHSGLHAGPITAASNQCALCHPGSTGSNGVGVSDPLHGNGTVDVSATFRSSCFGCH